jgi:hypothetical protein
VRGGLWIFAAPGRPWLRRPPPLPARGGSGSLVVALDLRTHQAVVEHSGGPVKRVPLTPNRAVADVTSNVLAVVAAVGGAVQINGVPREVPWPVSLDQDNEHASYDPDRVSDYFAAATRRRSPSRPSGRRSEAGRHRSMRGGGRSTWRTLIAGRRPRDDTLGEYILNWDDVRAALDPRAAALDFARSAFRPAESRGVQTAG